MKPVLPLQDDAEAAAWDFGTAQSLFPGYEKVDLEPYGPAGRSLNRYRYKNGTPPGPSAWSQSEGTTDPQVTPKPRPYSYTPPDPSAQ